MKVLETERLFLREMNMEDFDALYAVLADSEIMQHYPYSFDEKRVRDWAFANTDYPSLYSYCKYTNEPSYKTAEANGMTFRHMYEAKDGDLCRVYSITREEWEKTK